MVDQIVSGEGFHCALSNGGVQCWGKNNFGQLGDGTTTNSNVPVTTISFGVAALAKTDSGSSRHMCAIMTSGNVKCWGQNNYQQIGTGSPTGPQITPYQVNSLSNVDKLTIGRRHSCARTSTGEVVCWGSNSDGQLGKGYKNSTLPIQIQSATSVAKVVVGKDVTCYRNFSNTVSCFGSNRANELGNTTGEDVTGPFVNVSGTYTDLFASGDYMGLQICGKAISTGQVFCWGRSDIGPTAYTGLDTATYISGGNAHLCGVFGAGFASCGGSNTYGQLGLGYTSASETHSSQTLVPNTITSIAGGFGTTYTVHSDGSAYSWGYGTSGALGNGSTSHLATPAYQLPLTNVTKIIGAYTAACAVHDSGKLSCWGTGDLGVVGGVSNIPQRVSTLDGVSSLASGYRHVCALKSGTVWCWGGGMGEGETGTGSVMSNTVPKPVMNLQGVTSLWRGENAGSHSCAVKSDNTLWCWGNADVFIAPWGNEYMSGYAP
jgi:alpha-tubulin suppressor-like RCC1 family protein